MLKSCAVSIAKTIMQAESGADNVETGELNAFDKKEASCLKKTFG